VSDATFACPDLTTFCRLDELGLAVIGQRLDPDRAVLACRVVEPDQWCRRCGCEGVARDTVIRRLAHEPLGWRPTTLEVTLRRYRCAGCGHVWRQDTSRAAEPRARLSRRGLRWALEGIVLSRRVLYTRWGARGPVAASCRAGLQRAAAASAARPAGVLADTSGRPGRAAMVRRASGVSADHGVRRAAVTGGSIAASTPPGGSGGRRRRAALPVAPAARATCAR